MFCSRCGAPLNPMGICISCGLQHQMPPIQQRYQHTPNIPNASNCTVLLVLSIILSLFFLPAGIVGIVLSCNAKNALLRGDLMGYEKNKKGAMIAVIVGVSLFVVFTVLSYVFLFFVSQVTVNGFDTSYPGEYVYPEL